MAQIGRPRTFDRNEAIRQAMTLFWQHGYESTSLAMLKSNLGNGITAPSFYAAFGSKEALFEEVVDCYMTTFGQVNDCLWDDTLEPVTLLNWRCVVLQKCRQNRGIPVVA